MNRGLCATWVVASTALAVALTGFGTTAMAGSHRPALAAGSQQLAVGKTATFKYLTVSVLTTDRRSDSYFFGAKIKVCVTSLPKGTTSMRLSWDPWRINGKIRPGGFEVGEDPWSGRNAPTEGQFRIGQCLKGWLPFAVGGTTPVTKINYSNSLGNKVSWTVANPKSPQQALGTTATFRNFTVTVTDTRQSARGFRAYVKTCVRKLPAGSTGGKTKLTWEPWYANAGSHFWFVPHVDDPSHTWSGLYPRSGRYKVGQCAQGWMPFEGVHPTLKIDRVTYIDSLGNKAFWTAAK